MSDDGMAETTASAAHESRGRLMVAISNAMVALHKEQFGRGPTTAWSYFAGPDTLVCMMEDALLPAERALSAMGEQQRVRESRLFFQVATRDRFVAEAERILGRRTRALMSADRAPAVAAAARAWPPRSGSTWGTSPRWCTSAAARTCSSGRRCAREPRQA
jgi:uncharacterized protein YbcI